jgi:hypothetical protein
LAVGAGLSAGYAITLQWKRINVFLSLRTPKKRGTHACSGFWSTNNQEVGGTYPCMGSPARHTPVAAPSFVELPAGHGGVDLEECWLHTKQDGCDYYHERGRRENVRGRIEVGTGRVVTVALVRCSRRQDRGSCTFSRLGNIRATQGDGIKVGLLGPGGQVPGPDGPVSAAWKLLSFPARIS